MKYDRQISTYDIARQLKAERSAQMAAMFSTFVRSLFAHKALPQPLLG
ncbi:MAG: hypothetical protein ACRCS3_04365 [Paracoccaceae bacterium]